MAIEEMARKMYEDQQSLNEYPNDKKVLKENACEAWGDCFFEQVFSMDGIVYKCFKCGRERPL